MLQINTNISYRTFEKKISLQANKNESVNRNSYDTKRYDLLSNHYYLPINISFKASEFLNESDLKRYQKIQEEFAEIMAKTLDTTPNEILKKLPKIRFGDGVKMLCQGMNAVCLYHENIIEIAPYRKMANLFGGDASAVIHESVHGLLYNLRRIYARELGENKLHNFIYNSIVDKLAHGEFGKIIKGIIPSEQYPFKLMNPPPLSSEERKAVIGFIMSLKTEYLKMQDSCVLNNEGKKLLKKNLIPKLTEYSRIVVGDAAKKEEEIFNKILDYINSTFVRKDVVVDSLTLDKIYEYEKSVKSLSVKEQNMAIYSFYKLLDVIEGNYVAFLPGLKKSDNTMYQYFMTYEELLARDIANDYRMHKLQTKIEGLYSKGLSPSASLMSEYETTIYNCEFLKLVKKLMKVNAEIISAPKDSDKLIELEELQKHLEKLGNKYFKMNDLYKVPSSEKTLKELTNLQSVFEAEINKFHNLNVVENLLENTAENNLLKQQFNDLLQKIREIVVKCDISGIPRKFYASDKLFNQANKRSRVVMRQYLKKIQNL